MSAVATGHELPAQLVIVDDQVSAEISATMARSHAIVAIAGEVDHLAADALVGRIAGLVRQVEAARAAAKRPLIDLGRRIDELAGDALAPLVAEKQRIGRMMVAWVEAENRRREEERRRLEEQRRAAEEARRIAEEERMAAERAAAQPVDEWDALVEPAPAPREVVAEIMPPTIEQQQAAAPIKSRSVVQRMVKTVLIDESELLAAALAAGGKINGVQVLCIDRAAVEKAAKAGVPFPGVRIHESTTIAAKGR